MQLTKDQQAFVNSKNQNVLVSASAGSGKTSTMIEKLLQLVVKQGVSLNKLLVLTFTDAAANEMKQRLQTELAKKANELASILQTEKGNKQVEKELLRVQQSLEDLNFCDIGTFHATFKKIITKYFYLLELDPTFSLLTNEQDVVLTQAINIVFGNYAKQKDDAFYELSVLFTKRRSMQAFKDSIKSLYLMSREKINFDAWFESMVEKTYGLDLNKNQSALFLKQYYTAQTMAYQSNIQQVINTATALQIPKVAEYFDNLLQQIYALNRADSVTEFVQVLRVFDFGTLRFGSKLTPEQEEFRVFAKHLQKAIKKEFKNTKNGAMDVFASITETEMIEQLQAQKQQLSKLLEVLHETDKQYTKLKQAKSKLDFGDLQLVMVQLLQNKEVVKELQEQYDAIFVDEFQDINDIQFYIVHTISKENNVNYIGDVKQSIYEFRLASPEIFLAQLEEFEENKNAVVIPFNKNYRSSNHILQFVNNLFRVLITKDTVGLDYAKTSMLECGNEKMLEFDKKQNAEDLPVVSAVILNMSEQEQDSENNEDETEKPQTADIQQKDEQELLADEQEAQIVMQQILSVYHKPFYNPKTDMLERVEYKDIAVLTRDNGTINGVLTKLLEQHKIPVVATAKNNIFETYEVQVLYSFLKLLNNQNDDYALSTVMKSMIGGFSYNELAEIRLINNSKRVSFKTCLVAVLQDNTHVLNQKVTRFWNLLQTYRNKLQFQTVYEVMQDVVYEFNILQHFVSMPNGTFLQNNINEFFALLNTETFAYNITMCVTYLESLQSKETFEVNLAGGENAVTLLTMHKSKGLEWPVVILAGLGKAFSNKSSSGDVVTSQTYGVGFAYKEQETRTSAKPLSYHAIALHKKMQEMKEQIRLFYVATTRAKNYLFLTGKYEMQKVYTLQNKQILQSKNFMELFLKTLSEYDRNILANGSGTATVFKGEFGTCSTQVVTSTDQTVVTLQEFEESKLPKLEQTTLLKKLEQQLEYVYEAMPNIAVKNSVTGLLAEQDYVHQNQQPKTLTLEEGQSNDLALKIGTAYHQVMQHLTYQETKQQVEELLQKLVLSGRLEKELVSHIHINQIMQAISKIKPLMLRYEKVLKEQQFILQQPYNQFVENSTTTQPVMIQGVVDLMLLNGKNAVIIDFKTNKNTSPEKLRETYALQLNIYARACKQAFALDTVKKMLYSFELGDFVAV